MKELDLYRFVTDHKIEYHWDNDGKKIHMFVNYLDIRTFYSILTYNIFDEEGIECNMKDGYFAFEMVEICEYYDIESERVFSKE